MRLGIFASLSLLAAAGALAAPLSKQAALRIMHDRHEGMEAVGKTNKVLRRELSAGAPNLRSVRSAARTMASLAGKSSKWFPLGTGPEMGKTGAKPEIWQKPEDFAAKQRDFQAAAKALDRAARAGDLTQIKTGYAALGKTCKACHDSYRNEMHH
jgi:cytochrome c556